MSAIFNVFVRKISAKLIAVFLAISLIPLAIIGYVSINSASSSLQEREFEELQAIGTLKAERVKDYLNSLFIPLDVSVQSKDITNAYNLLKEYHDKEGELANGSFDISTKNYHSIYDQIDPFFSSFIQSFGYDDLYFICAEHGHIMYTSHREEDLGTNLITGKYSNSNLAELWRKIKSTGEPAICDFAIYGTYGEAEAFLGAPVKDKNGTILAIIILEILPEHINQIMTGNQGIVDHGEAYIVGEDKLLRTDVKSESGSTIMKKTIDTESVKLGLESKTGVHLTTNYRGEDVLSFYMHLDLENSLGTDFDWAIVSEVNKDKALAPVFALEKEILLLTLLIALLVLFFALVTARYFSKPIQQISELAQSASLGDFNNKIENKRKDELGILADSFEVLQETMKEKARLAMQISRGDLTVKVNVLSEKDEMGKAFQIMAENLNDQINNINEVVATLTSSNIQLMSTISELSSSSTETASTVSEITSTIEEVKQTAEVTTQKARNVSSTAQKSVQYSENGIKATEDSLEGMHHIHEQVKLIAETIIKLSEQSQTIGDITNTVNDIAEQSNLLAVNASIEAVKAGEYGKGFGVVAQEIRALADQSKQSTLQIRTILNEVQKAVGAAVMATEQGGKAVEKGITLSEASGDSISMLADSISEAAIASSQIAVSSNQQLTGMEQLTQAMDNIKLAASQNAAGAKQSEEAVSNIKNIVQKLTDLIKMYKTV